MSENPGPVANATAHTELIPQANLCVLSRASAYIRETRTPSV